MSQASARYRILHRLGQGGMAEVFEAELAGELGFVRKVAIKRMLADAAADAECAKRFLDEARIASQLHHANIVSVVDMGLLDQLPFQVLELVEGIDANKLQQRAGGVLPLEVALIITSDVAHALDHAHTARDAGGSPLGIVHRDVKPSNVLVSWGGDVKLTDFGIAFARDRVTKTEAGLVAGTTGFIAPEQRMRTEIDGRTDVFALGLTLHAMLTGYTPLQDITVEMATLTGVAVPLDQMLPAEIRDVIARAVTPDKRDRLTAAQFADKLGAILAPRLKGNPRGHLRAFLAPLQDNQPKVGALDQLLGFDVVLTGEPAGDAPRHYALRPTAVVKPSSRADAATAVVRAASPDPGQSLATMADTPAGRAAQSDAGASYASTTRHAVADDANAPAVRSRGTRLALVGVAMLGLGGITTWQVVSRTGNRAQHAAHDLDAAVVVASPPDAETRASQPDAGLQAEAPADAAVVANVVKPPRTVRDARRGSASVVETQPAVVTSAAVTGTGYLQITGEDNIGAKILVDGREVGYAPNKLEVPRGHHRLSVVRKDGTKLGGDIDVTEYHTVSRPLQPSL